MAKLSDEMEFFIYLLNFYSDYKHTTADKVLKRWDELGVTQLIIDMYWRYHSEAIENAYDDIDEICREREEKLKNKI